MSSGWLSVAEIFGEDVFNDAVMQERLPKKVYKKLKQTIEEGKELDLETADVIAHEMKEWAIEKGATHYTHWFQPLTGVSPAGFPHSEIYGSMDIFMISDLSEVTVSPKTGVLPTHKIPAPTSRNLK